MNNTAHSQSSLSRRILTTFICLILFALNGEVFAMAAESHLTAITANSETTALAGSEAFTGYVHDPMDNPKAAQDIIVDPEAIYGYSPNPDSGSLTNYARPNYDWSDRKTVTDAQADREIYHQQIKEMYQIAEDMIEEGRGVEDIVRALSSMRNQIRLDSYKDDPEGLDRVRKRNLERYGSEEGPTIEYLQNQGKSWQDIILSAFATNPGMDACLGLYDKYYEEDGQILYLVQETQKTISIESAKVKLSASSFTYDGKIHKLFNRCFVVKLLCSARKQSSFLGHSRKAARCFRLRMLLDS